MTGWTQGGVALPSRKDVPTPAGKDVLTAESCVCKTGLGVHARLHDSPEGVPGRVHQRRSRRRAFNAGAGRDARRSGAITRRYPASDAGASAGSRPGRPDAGASVPGTTRLRAIPDDAAREERANDRDRLAMPGRRARARRAARARSEAIAGYLFIAVPMVLFLVLNIGVDRLRGLHQPLEVEHSARGRSRSSARRTTRTPSPTRSSRRAIKNTIYYAIIWVPLTMAVGLFLAVIVNQKIRGQTFFRAAFYFPAIASSAAITMLWIFLVAPDGLFNEVRARDRPQPALLAVRLHGRTRTGSATRDTAMNSIMILNAWTTSGHVHAVLPRVAPVDQPGDLRGGRDRRRQRVEHVLARSRSRCCGRDTSSSRPWG